MLWKGVGLSRYVARIIGPVGRATYLFRGREVGDEEHATHYPHPSNAWQAARNYREKHKGLVLTYDVIDTRDPERRVSYNGEDRRDD